MYDIAIMLFTVVYLHTIDTLPPSLLTWQG